MPVRALDDRVRIDGRARPRERDQTLDEVAGFADREPLDRIRRTSPRNAVTARQGAPSANVRAVARTSRTGAPGASVSASSNARLSASAHCTSSSSKTVSRAPRRGGRAREGSQRLPRGARAGRARRGDWKASRRRTRRAWGRASAPIHSRGQELRARRGLSRAAGPCEPVDDGVERVVRRHPLVLVTPARQDERGRFAGAQLIDEPARERALADPRLSLEDHGDRLPARDIRISTRERAELALAADEERLWLAPPAPSTPSARATSAPVARSRGSRARRRTQSVSRYGGTSRTKSEGRGGFEEALSLHDVASVPLERTTAGDRFEEDDAERVPVRGGADRLAESARAPCKGRCRRAGDRLPRTARSSGRSR